MNTVNLDNAYKRNEWRLPGLIRNDPVEFVHGYKDKQDAEIAGFLASQFAYGRIEVFKRFLGDIFTRMGPSPRTFVDKGDWNPLEGCYYRLHKDREIIALFEVLRKVITEFGGIGRMIEYFYCGDIQTTLRDIRTHLFRNGRELLFFFPEPSASGTLKRWNLYMRWMVRKDAVDIGLWNFIDKRDLIMPLDTHIFKIGRCQGWTSRKTATFAAAKEITGALRRVSPEDPLKYDFFLCHVVGIGGQCAGRPVSQCLNRCSLVEKAGDKR